MSYILIVLAAIAVVFLGVKFINKRKDKLSILLDAGIIYEKLGDRENVKGTVAVDNFDIRHEMLLNVRVTNNGEKDFEVSHIFMEVELENGVCYEVRVTPEELPEVVEEFSSIEIKIQKEWLDYENVNSFGVIDSKGKYYYLPKKQLDELWKESNDLPSYKDRDCDRNDPNKIMKSFKANDKSEFIKKNR